jgi:hypothetical protein
MCKEDLCEGTNTKYLVIEIKKQLSMLKTNGFAVNSEDLKWWQRRKLRTGASAAPTAVAPTATAEIYIINQACISIMSKLKYN